MSDCFLLRKGTDVDVYLAYRNTTTTYTAGKRAEAIRVLSDDAVFLQHFQDLTNGSADLRLAFREKPELVKAWEVLYDLTILRENVDVLEIAQGWSESFVLKFKKIQLLQLQIILKKVL